MILCRIVRPLSGRHTRHTRPGTSASMASPVMADRSWASMVTVTAGCLCASNILWASAWISSAVSPFSTLRLRLITPYSPMVSASMGAPPLVGYSRVHSSLLSSVTVRLWILRLSLHSQPSSSLRASTDKVKGFDVMSKPSA